VGRVGFAIPANEAAQTGLDTCGSEMLAPECRAQKFELVSVRGAEKDDASDTHTKNRVPPCRTAGISRRFDCATGNTLWGCA
jgi:hypothetical protein